MRITAVCGWAISPSGFRKQLEPFFPNEQIRIIYPERPEDDGEAKGLLDEFSSDLYVGYSLGSLWLLRHRRHIPETSAKVLLAPILGFTKEKELGGKIPLGQLRYFIRNLHRAGDMESVVSEFYDLGKINMPLPSRDEFSDKEVLIRGLEFLKTVCAPAAENWMALLGEKDPFLDWTQLQAHIPNLQVVPNAGHSPDSLLKQLAGNPDIIQRSFSKTEPPATKNTL